LMLASGAGEAGRHSVGTTVFGGMIMSTMLNLFFIPVLYLIIEGWRERGGVKVAEVKSETHDAMS
jgi:HAE1 family hydrophobic/amphiphilic exporter-1